MPERTWPELSEELSRKALTVMDDAIHRHLVDGDLTRRELRLVTDAVVDCISGLVPTDVLNAVYSVRKDLDLDER